MKLTLEDLKKRPLNKDMYDCMYETWELGDDHNISVYRNNIRNGNEHDIKNECYDMTHDGNDPRSNKDMLDRARCFYEDKVYTDEVWDKYFIPAINKAIESNDNFERWYPGYLIKNKNSGKLAILEADYSFKYGGRNFTSLAIYDLKEDGSIDHWWAWANYDNYELVDKTHMAENLEKIAKFEEGNEDDE